MIKPPSILAAPLEKGRVRILLDFGRHQLAEDARSLESAFRSFQPHIYVPEKAGLGRAERVAMIARLNGMLALEDGAASLLDCAERHSAYDMRGFAREELRLAYNQRLAGIYLAEEGAEMDDWSLIWMMMAYSRSASEAMRLLIGNEPEAAIRMAENGIREFAKTSLIERNNIVVQGMERFLAEALGMFPGLPCDGEIRVLIRYGTTHLALAEMLESAGFTAGIWNVPPLDFNAELLVRLSRDFNTPLSHEEGMRLIFSNLYSEATARVGENACEAALASSMSTAYSRIGGEAGFLSMLRFVSAKTPGPEGGVEAAKKALSEIVESGDGDIHE